MKKDFLKDEGNALRVQKHQLENTEDKIYEIDNVLSNIQQEQLDDDNSLDDMLQTMDNLLAHNKPMVTDTMINENIASIEDELDSKLDNKDISLISQLDNISIDDNSSWEEYMSSVENYGFKHNLNLKEDPFKYLMTKSQQAELQQRIQEDFTFKNANCDIHDYMIAVTCGAIGGLVDILFVGAPGDSKLGNIADEHANKITEKFAEFLGWENNGDTANAVEYLENKFKIKYDQTTLDGYGEDGNKVSASTHHLYSLGHSPDIIGLLFSIYNQFTSTSSFIKNGEIITIDTETFELKGNDFVSKIFCGFANWFGHLMSDWIGSKKAVEKGNRGSGLPIPFYNLMQMMDFGEFGLDKQTFATITRKVFESGYDFRHGMAMAVPVVITELLVRFMYTMKKHFYHAKDWKDSIPDANIPEVRRMLLVGHGTLCLMDGVDAGFRSSSNIVVFLSRTNLIGWVRFGHLSLKEVNAWYNEGKIDNEKVDEYLNKEYKKMLQKVQ